MRTSEPDCWSQVKTDPSLPGNDYYVVYRRERANALLKEVRRIAHECCDFRHPSSAQHWWCLIITLTKDG